MRTSVVAVVVVVVAIACSDILVPGRIDGLHKVLDVHGLVREVVVSRRESGSIVVVVLVVVVAPVARLMVVVSLIAAEHAESVVGENECYEKKRNETKRKKIPLLVRSNPAHNDLFTIMLSWNPQCFQNKDKTKQNEFKLNRNGFVKTYRMLAG